MAVKSAILPFNFRWVSQRQERNNAVRRWDPKTLTPVSLGESCRLLSLARAVRLAQARLEHPIAARRKMPETAGIVAGAEADIIWVIVGAHQRWT